MKRTGGMVVYLGFLNGVLDFGVRLGVGNGVTNANCVAFDQQPVIDDNLDVGVELASLLISLLKIDNVQQRSTTCTKRLLAQDATDKLAIFHQHLTTVSQQFQCNQSSKKTLQTHLCYTYKSTKVHYLHCCSSSSGNKY